MTEGLLLGGKYRLEKLIGRGGMGSVWRAHHLGLNAPVAVKLLNLEVGSDSEIVNRFHREARAAAAIRSPHVVQILDHGVDEASRAPFIVMELMEGESLAERLDRVQRIPPAGVQRIFTQVARALTRAHEAGIVHRDLKPDNVFLVRNEDDEVAKVLDFGIAKAQAHGFAGASATQTGAVMGTAYYMSPEQISGGKNIDHRTDLWAFGVMACECLTGQRPFQADSFGGLTLRICVEPPPVPSSLGAVPLGFDAWFAKIMQRDPEQRFATAREAAEALRFVCTGDTARELVADSARGTPPAAGRVSHAPNMPSSGTAAALSRSSGSERPARAKPRFLLPVSLAGAALIAGLGVWALRRAPALHSESVQPRASAPAAVAAPLSAAPVAEPVKACEAGAARCTATTPETCVDGQWNAAQITVGTCGAACTPNVSPPQCNGSAPQLCDATGHWQSAAPCSATQQCRAGECVSKSQAPGPASKASARAAATPKPDCEPSYTLDSEGQKHFKPECFK